MSVKKKLLNLGCGNNFRKEWINIDFTSRSEYVTAHNLLMGIPFNDNEFDVVYHSHLLEHFPKNKALGFINECYRVLKPGGIIRIAVPDLERIVKLYLENLKKALKGDKKAHLNYNWIMLELFDQIVRNRPGGEMLEYFKQENIANLDFVYERFGSEARSILRNIKNSQSNKSQKNNLINEENIDESFYTKIGRFRMGGEIHQWMYDRFSLREILKQSNFKKIEIKTAFTSNIKNWIDYELDIIDGEIRKPDSLFMEGKK